MDFVNKKEDMKVLIGCEYSGIVRDAFSRMGWDAWSCDILPTESELTIQEGKHYQCDIFEVLYQDWDLLIAFPPCTYLSFAYTGKERYSIERLQNKINAYQFFLNLWSAPINHICLENPIGYIHSGLLPYSQIVNPYYFGDNYKKKTGLWLKNLPSLMWSDDRTLFHEKTSVVPEYLLVGGSGKRAKLPEKYSGKSTAKLKSKFHKGIANAMSEQWTEYIKNYKK